MGVDAAKVNLKGEALLSARAGYYGLINHLDDQIHRLINPITGIVRTTGGNTAVILTSDHGEMLGDHYFWRKSLPYEGAARIPFLIRAPEYFGFRKNTVIDAPVGLEDLMPTILDMADVDIPNSVDGKSLLPLLRGESAAECAWRDCIHVEHSPTFHALINEKEKYIWFVKDGTEQLFDLKKDPEECSNLVGNPEYADSLLQWRERMVRELTGRPEGFTDGTKLISGRPYPGIINLNQDLN